jgi:hypothetical protein
VKRLKFANCRIQQTTMLRFTTSSRKLEEIRITRSGPQPESMTEWLESWYKSTLHQVAITES